MNEKKKAIVLLVPGFPSNEQDTTCMPFLQQFCLSFIRICPEIELRVVSFQYPHKRGYYLWNGIKIYCAGGKSHKFNRIFTWGNVFMQLLKTRRQFNIAVINSFWMTECTLVGQYFSRLFNIRQVSYLIGQDALKANRYLPLINFSKMKIVAMSESLVNHFLDATGVKIKYIIPAGIDMAKIKAREELRTTDILGVGTLVPLKNYLLFAEIINGLKKDFPSVKACIIGKGSQEHAIKEYIKMHKLEDNLELPGELPHREVFSYMQKSKIFLHTSSYEGQSTVIMEALACGLNIVCFDIGRVHVEGKIWACENKEQMVAKLKELLSAEITFEPVVPLTSDDMVREFLRIYEI